MIRNAIPTVSESRQASARAAGRRSADMRNRLVRVTGPDEGVFTIAQIAARLNAAPAKASTAVARARTDGAVTWAALARKAGRPA